MDDERPVTHVTENSLVGILEQAIIVSPDVFFEGGKCNMSCLFSFPERVFFKSWKDASAERIDTAARSLLSS